MQFRLKSSLYFIIPAVLAGCSSGGKDGFELDDLSFEAPKQVKPQVKNQTQAKSPTSQGTAQSSSTGATSQSSTAQQNVVQPVTPTVSTQVSTPVSPTQTVSPELTKPVVSAPKVSVAKKPLLVESVELEKVVPARPTVPETAKPQSVKPEPIKPDVAKPQVNAPTFTQPESVSPTVTTPSVAKPAEKPLAPTVEKPTENTVEKPIEQPSLSPEKTATYVDEPSEKRAEWVAREDLMLQPALGYEMRAAHLNNRSKPKQAYIALNSGEILEINGDIAQTPHLEELKALEATEGKNFKHKISEVLDRSYQDFQHIKAGLVFGHAFQYLNQEMTVWYRGIDGYVFYQGDNPSKALPVGKVVHYNGQWDFLTDAKRDRPSNGMEDGAGTESSAVSAFEDVNRNPELGAVGHTSTFEVDFDQKKLTGQLSKNSRPLEKDEAVKSVKRYDIDAQLVGNRFIGNATAKSAKSVYFGKDSHNVEGGFYGPNGEELAGKFLTEDNSLFVVFAAKQDGQPAEATVFVDAKKIDLKDHQLSELVSYGDISTLMIGGQKFTLSPAVSNRFSQQLKFDEVHSINLCCSNLDYVKYGTFHSDNENAQFLQGERTAKSEMPTSGEHYYKGSWIGNFAHHSGSVVSVSANNEEGGSRADFSVNFGAKTVSGKLIAENRIEPTLSIEGKIVGNGFTGVANTGARGFVLDPYSSNAKAVNLSAEVQGGFYGPKATELGGVISTNHLENGDKVSAVFGAKRQVKQ